MTKLRRRQKLFVEYYLQLWNGAEAARRAGFAPKHAASIATHLMAKPEIKEQVELRMSEIAMKTDEVLLRLTQQARVSLADFVYSDTTVQPSPDGGVTTVKTVGINWDAIQESGHLVKSIKPTTNGIALELHDPQAALEKIGRALGMFKDNLNLTGEKIVVTLKSKDD
jgi:phage terminase small subunit